MSAYMVDREHIGYLMAAATSFRLGRYGISWHDPDGNYKTLSVSEHQKAFEIGQILWDENMKSINARYPDTVDHPENAPGKIGENFELVPQDISKAGFYQKFEPVQVIKSCDCLEYQSCEHEGWLKSEACAFLTALREAAIHILPGYDDAAWGAPKRIDLSVIEGK